MNPLERKVINQDKGRGDRRIDFLNLLLPESIITEPLAFHRCVDSVTPNADLKYMMVSFTDNYTPFGVHIYELE